MDLALLNEAERQIAQATTLKEIERISDLYFDKLDAAGQEPLTAEFSRILSIYVKRCQRFGELPPYTEEEVQARLEAEGYTKDEARVGTFWLLKRLRPYLYPIFSRWWHTGETPDLVMQDVRFSDLLSEGFSIPAAFIVISELERIPEDAIEYVRDRVDPIIAQTAYLQNQSS